MSSPIVALPSMDRPRERLARHGAAFLTDRELVAVLLGSGTRSANALDVGGKVLHHAGDLRALSTATMDDLLAVRGVGGAKAAAVVAAFELGRRAGAVPPPVVLDSSLDIVASARPLLTGLRRERVVVLVCDSGHRLRRSVVLTDGSVDASLVPVREVLHAVLRADGKAFALAHNHPSGIARPSCNDRAVTERLHRAATLVNVRFLDHVIITEDSWCSIGEQRLHDAASQVAREDAV